MRTEITELLGIQYPIIQGGMAWVAEHHLAAGVSEAGGLGLIGAASAPADWVRQQIREARKKTEKPFGVNIMLMSPYASEVSDVVIEEGVPVLTTGAGNPLVYMKKWTQAGIKVIPVVASVALAQMVEKRGACAVVAEGGESGGHIGEANTMPLVPQIVDAVKIPVIAAGGIADGRGVAAAFMLGAAGVQIGTRFLVAKECTIHETYKQKVLKANDTGTTVGGRRLGHPVRALKSPFTKRYAELEKNPTVSDEELSALGTGALYLAAREGDWERGSFLCGQAAGLVKEEQSCKDILLEIMRQTEETLQTAACLVKR